MAPNDYDTIFNDIELIVPVNIELLRLIKNHFRLNNLLTDDEAPNDKVKHKSMYTFWMTLVLALGEIFWYFVCLQKQTIN